VKYQKTRPEIWPTARRVLPVGGCLHADPRSLAQREPGSAEPQPSGPDYFHCGARACGHARVRMPEQQARTMVEFLMIIPANRRPVTKGITNPRPRDG
jgi:hypothetical protein